MKKFELVKIGFLCGKDIEAYRCLDDSHVVKMTDDEAVSRGVRDKWLPECGGVRAQVFASVTPIDLKLSVPRPVRRDKVVKVKGTLVRCDRCGYSETVLPVSPGDFLFEKVTQGF